MIEALLEPQVPRANKDLRDRKDQRDLVAVLDNLVLQVLLEILARVELLEALDNKELLVFLERLVLKDHRVQ